MKKVKNNPTSTYLAYLPTLFQEVDFLGGFLLAFEKVLSGLDHDPGGGPQDLHREDLIIGKNLVKYPGLEEVIDNIDLFFDPMKTPKEFLPWLAGWVALSLRDDWEEDVKRAFIAAIVSLYTLRGTKVGLKLLLNLYLKNAKVGSGDSVEIFDDYTEFPHYFQVQLTLSDRDSSSYAQQLRIAQAVISQEKPAQTYYSLKILVPTMRITEDTVLPQDTQIDYGLVLEIVDGDHQTASGQTIPTFLGTTSIE